MSKKKAPERVPAESLHAGPVATTGGGAASVLEEKSRRGRRLVAFDEVPRRTVIDSTTLRPRRPSSATPTTHVDATTGGTERSTNNRSRGRVPPGNRGSYFNFLICAIRGFQIFMAIITINRDSRIYFMIFILI